MEVEWSQAIEGEGLITRTLREPLLSLYGALVASYHCPGLGGAGEARLPGPKEGEFLRKRRVGGPA
jgi:hypothetical protein